MQSQGKISFGFSKLTKKPSLILKKPQEEKKVELIDCLEGQSIKIKDAIEEEENKPLIIPIKDNQKNLLDRVKEARSKQSNSLKKESKEDERPDSELTIEELAARELIKDAKHRLEQNSKTASKILLLPTADEKLELNGEIEPTLEDYENVPINDFGLAMLRGMGWNEGTGIGKNPSKKTSMASAPELRPKGLGLGATRQIKGEKPKTSLDKEGKELLLIKGAFAKIIAGNNKGNYCEVQGLDDEAGRVIVKTSLKNEILNVNEFLLVPVTKEEYAKGAKVINNAKYEEYKELMDKKLQMQREAIKKEESRRDKYSDERPSASSSRRRDYSSDEDNYPQKSKVINISSSEDDEPRKKEKSRKNRSRSRSYERKEKKSKHKKKSRNSSSESSDYERKKKKKKKKSKSRYRSSSSDDYKKSHRSRR